MLHWLSTVSQVDDAISIRLSGSSRLAPGLAQCGLHAGLFLLVGVGGDLFPLVCKYRYPLLISSTIVI